MWVEPHERNETNYATHLLEAKNPRELRRPVDAPGGLAGLSSSAGSLVPHPEFYQE
jgi:hypothetical protein